MIMNSILAVFSPILVKLKNKYIKNTICLTFIIFTIYNFFMRNLDTPDTKNYEYIYNNISSGKEIVQRLEPLYKYFIKMSNYIFKDFRIYLFFLTISFFYLWIKITKFFLKDLTIIYGTFFLTYGIYFFGITLRQGIAFIISYIGLKNILNNKQKIGFLFIIFSILIHSSMLVYIITVPFCKKKIGVKLLNWILIIGIIYNIFLTRIFNLELIKVISKILLKLELFHYMAYLKLNTGFSLNTLYYTILTFLLINYRKNIKGLKNIKEYNFFLNLFMIGILILNFLSFFKGVSRLADIYMVYFSIVLGKIYFNIENKYFKLFFILMMICNNLLLLYLNFKFLNLFYI